ncbi:MAG: LLM class flavin-dependent oxidoreductase [Candidatus Hodarchaeales archaeon]|jgi:alkanesulfonate monooxygenase SsuD/methylene tetrahydromethanopterin reductase-like flavin-dependent oxidoreductase (luciferase family)
MKYGINIPNFGALYKPDDLANLAQKAEEVGWDGFFLWDHLIIDRSWRIPFVDPWIALSAIAMKTEKIHIGPLITPLPRRKPWKVARESVSLDHLSNGRLILGVGLGAPDTDYSSFGEDIGAKIRAKKLDEGLDILIGLWSGEPFSFSGEIYSLEELTFLPKAIQTPQIPIWVGGGWPNKKPFRRAALYDGVCPISANWPDVLTPDDIKEVVNYTYKHRDKKEPLEIITTGETPVDDDKGTEIVAPYIDAGATWWIEDINWMRGTREEMIERIRGGPPRTS